MTSLALLLAACLNPHRLVGDLGSDSYHTRHRAEVVLKSIGMAGKSAVVCGLRSADPEVRERCLRVWWMYPVNHNLMEYPIGSSVLVAACKSETFVVTERWSINGSFQYLVDPPGRAGRRGPLHPWELRPVGPLLPKGK